jgi:hypothetical protein
MRFAFIEMDYSGGVWIGSKQAYFGVLGAGCCVN